MRRSLQVGFSVRNFLNIVLFFSVLLQVVLPMPANAFPVAEDHRKTVFFDAPRKDGSLSGSKAEVVVAPGLSSIQTLTGVPKVVLDNGRSTNRIDIVFLGDGYKSQELTKFSDQVLAYTNGLTAQEPFLEYAGFFNVHRVDIASNDSGVDGDEALGVLKDTVLDTEFWCQGNQGTLCTNVSKAWSFAALARDFDHIVVLANSTSPGAAAYPFSDLSVVSALQPQNIDSALHQLGHSFGNLADEYENGPWPTYTGFEPAEPNVSAQNSDAMKLQNIKWVKWLGATAFGSVIGTHEGAMGSQSGIFRPTLTSKMRELSAPFNAPSVESIIKEIYRKVRPIDDATPNSPGLTGQNTFFVKPLKTRGSTVKVQWYVDGILVSGANGETFRPNNYSLADGNHTILARVVDTTSWLRDENFRNTYMTEERSWVVAVDQNAPIISQHPASITKYPGESAPFAVQAVGEDLNYQWYKNGIAIPGATGSSILVTPVKRAQSNDEFWVVVSNVAGSVRSNSAVLNVGNHAPQYSGSYSVSTYRGASAGFNFSLTDVDGDPLSVSAAFDAAGLASGASIIVSDGQFDLKTGSSFIGSYVVTLTVTDQITEIKIPISVVVSNRLPVIGSVPNQTVNWGTDSIAIDLNATDLDTMDTLTYSASLNAYDVGSVQLRVSGKTLVVDPMQNYIGQFVVTAKVSDGIGSSQTQFVVNWANGAPTISPISDQRMFYKQDSISIPISATDPNGDTLDISAKVASGATSLGLSYVNGILTINPPSLFQGISQINVTASDGNLTSSRNFSFEAYNSAPVIGTISNQKISPQKTSLNVPVSASDPDIGDTVVLSATFNGNVPQGSNLVIENNAVVVSSAQPFVSGFQIKVSATDGDKTAEKIFPVSITNSAPVLTTIPDQKIHPINEDKRTVNLSATDSDGDTLVYSAKLVSPSFTSLVSIAVVDNILTIDPVKDYLGSYDIRVEVSDGISSSSQNFNVTAYNNAPEITPICDRTLSTEEFPLSIPIKVVDKDNESLSFEVKVESANLAYKLDSKYNFFSVLGVRGYNVFGRQEKYLIATVNNKPNSLVFITPDAKLYLAGESFESSTLLETTQQIFYQDPMLLVDAKLDTEVPQIIGVVENSTLKLSLDGNFSGTAMLRLRAHDGFTFDEESFLVGVSKSAARIGKINTIRSHWTEGKKVIEIPIEGPDSILDQLVVKQAMTIKAEELDRLYQFAYLMGSNLNPIIEAERPLDNNAGRQEKYFVGLDAVAAGSSLPLKTTPKVYAIVPDGTIYSCVRASGGNLRDAYSISRSIKVGQVDSVFYEDLELLISPPTTNEVTVSLLREGKKLTIDSPDGFIGKTVLEFSLGYGYGTMQYVVFDKYDTRPVVEPVALCPPSNPACNQYSWKTKEIRLPIKSADADPEDANSLITNFSVQGLVPYSYLDKYDLRPDSPIAGRYNVDGWREMRLLGKYENRSAEFAILPSGALYADWDGAPSSSKLVTYVNYAAYLDPTLVDGRQWISDSLDSNKLKNMVVSVDGSDLVLTTPSDFRSNFESIIIQGQVVDGLSMGQSESAISLVNSAPQIKDVSPISLHWRTSEISTPISIFDPDGVDDLKAGLTTLISLSQQNGSPGRMQVSANQDMLSLSISPGVPRTFALDLIAEDTLGLKASKSVAVGIFNNAPTLDKIGSKKFVHSTQSTKILLSGSDLDKLDQTNLKFLAHPGTPDQYAGNLVSMYKLKNQSAIPFGALGSFEYHLLGEFSGVVQEFLVMPTGALYKWDGHLDAEDLLGFFPKTLLQNISTLLAKAPTTFSTASAVVSGNELTLTRNGAAVSPTNHNITVWVTDGIEGSFETFDVQWQDRAPILPSQASVQGHWRNGPLSISGFSALDEDSDPISYTLVAKNGTGYATKIVGDALTVTPNANSSLTQIVEVRANSTSLSNVGTYTFSFTNQVPVIQSLPSLSVGYKETVSFPVSAVDPDSDPMLYLVSLQGAASANYRATITGGVVNIVPIVPTPGVVTGTITVSDTISSVTGQFVVNYRNRAPVLSPLSSTSMKWSEKSRSIPVVVSDPDDDPIVLTASLAQAASIATANVSNRTVTVALKAYAPFLDVTVTARDQVNKVESTSSIAVTNIAPQIIPLPPSKTVHWTADSITVPVIISDQDGDPLALDAKVVDSAFPAVPRILSGNLVVDLPEHKVGKFTVEVGVSDGVVRSASRMVVQVLNQTPKLAELSNVILSSGSTNGAVNLEPSDPDNDPVTVSAKLVSIAQVAFELNTVHNFFRGSLDFGYNKLGNGEKYLKGRRASDLKDNDYVIYPNGRMYIWSGALSTSTYLGTIPSEFYLDPSKLIAAPASSDSVTSLSLSLDGNSVKISPNQSFIGTAWVYAAVTDTRDSSGIFFSVTLDGAEVPSDPDLCKTHSDEYDGEYESDGDSSFEAEGCIGDSANGSNKNTSEVRCGKETGSGLQSGESNHYSWISGRKVAFSITYDPDVKVANFTLDGKSVSHHVDNIVSISDLLIRGRRASQSSSLNITDLKLNGEVISGGIYVSDSTSQVKVLRVRSAVSLKKKFTFEGSVQMNFSNGVKNSDLGFQINFVRSSDAPESCDSEGDDDGDDDGDDEDEDGDGVEGSGKKVTICHIPSGDFTKAKTLVIGKSALEAHLRHGDIIGECPGQPNDPGDPSQGGPSCEQKQIFSSPNYTLWNSFLRMTNILELTNGTNKDIPVKVTLYSINGVLFDQRIVTVRANNQFDLIVNDLKNFVVDSYGIVKLEFEGNIDGRMSFYRPSSDRTGFDFAFSIPLMEATFGTTAVSFNTFQPSNKPEEFKNQVANWLSIVNLDSVPRNFTVFTYNNVGTLIMRREIEVPSFGRADVDGGHGLVGPNVVGFHKIVPAVVTAEYIAQLSRFGGDSPAGFAPSKFKFAVPLSSKLGQSDPIYMPISNKFGESNWIEVVNILDKEVGASVNYYSKSGQLLESVDARIAPNAQIHFNASAALPTGDNGYAVVVPFEPFSIVAQSMGYLRESATGSVTAVYGSQGRRVVPCAQSGSYNLFLNMQNWLVVANPTNSTVEATVLFAGPTSSAEKAIVLAPRALVTIPIHGNAELKTQPDTYGLVTVYPKDPSLRLYSEVLRLRYRANGNPDFAVPVPVR